MGNTLWPRGVTGLRRGEPAQPAWRSRDRRGTVRGAAGWPAAGQPHGNRPPHGSTPHRTRRGARPGSVRGPGAIAADLALPRRADRRRRQEPPPASASMPRSPGRVRQGAAAAPGYGLRGRPARGVGRSTRCSQPRPAPPPAHGSEGPPPSPTAHRGRGRCAPGVGSPDRGPDRASQGRKRGRTGISLAALADSTVPRLPA